MAAGRCTLTLNTAGARILRAIYEGDTNFNASTSPDNTHEVGIGIELIYPVSASPGERVRMTIIGSGFVEQSRISIEGADLSILTRFVSSNRLTATIIVHPNAFKSVRAVTVTNPDGASTTVLNAFVVK